MQGSCLRPSSQVLLLLYATSTQVPTGLQQTMTFTCGWVWSLCLLGAHPSPLQTAPRAEDALPMSLMTPLGALVAWPTHSLYPLELLVLCATGLEDRLPLQLLWFPLPTCCSSHEHPGLQEAPSSALREPLRQGDSPAPLTCILTFVIKAKRSETPLRLPAHFSRSMSDQGNPIPHVPTFYLQTEKWLSKINSVYKQSLEKPPSETHSVPRRTHAFWLGD